MDLRRRIEAENIPLPPTFWDHIEYYKTAFFEWNRIHNLSGAKDMQTLDLFIFDAVFPLSFLQPPQTLLDIGTGAGFPGLILAMALPQTAVTLCEPLGKRASFLQFVKAKLRLENTTVERKRVEDLKSPRFDLITSRAVTNTRILLEISAHLRDANTRLLFYKGEDVFLETPENLPHKVIIANKRHYLLIDKELQND